INSDVFNISLNNTRVESHCNFLFPGCNFSKMERSRASNCKRFLRLSTSSSIRQIANLAFDPNSRKYAKAILQIKQEFRRYENFSEYWRIIEESAFTTNH